MKTKNEIVNLEPKTTLFSEEADVIKTVLKKVLETVGKNPKTGTFLFWGVDDKTHKLQKIISFDFQKGPSTSVKFVSYEDGYYNSREKAEAILKRDAKNNNEGKSSHISYYIDSQIFMILQTTLGRFLCALYSDDLDYSDMNAVYCGIAKALSIMGKEDEILQQATDILIYTTTRDNPFIPRMCHEVEEMFINETEPDIHIWRAWHNSSVDELTLFFG